MLAPAQRPALTKHHSMPSTAAMSSASPGGGLAAQPPQAPPMTEAERLQKAKIEAVKKQVQQKRQLLLQKFSAEI